MRGIRFGAMMLAVGVWFGLAAVRGGAAEKPAGGGVAPLSLEGFLDEKLPDAPQTAKPLLVDNGACFVCHGNFQEEQLALVHAREKVGCMDCHGKSVEHRNDENNIIPPDKMYPLEAVDEMCGECHQEHDVAARQVIARWQERCPQKTDVKEIVCTDCHFQHRLTLRTVRWDKKTGQLLVKPKGPVKTRAGSAGRPGSQSDSRK